MPHRNNRPVRTRHRTGHQDCMVLRDNVDNLEIEHRRLLVPHLSGHPQTLAHPARIGAVTDRATVPEILMSPVRAGKSGEMMPLDYPGVAMALGNSAYVDRIA